MNYRPGLLRYPKISQQLPKPLSMAEPVFIHQSSLSADELSTQISMFESAAAAAAPSTTHVIKNGEVVPSNNLGTRNSYDLNVENITKAVKLELSRAARLAWSNFSFCSRAPLPNQLQALMYREGGFFVPHYDDSYGHMGSLYRNRPDRSLTVLIYLNDNYEGGELAFPKLLDWRGNPLVIKPRAGQILAFPPHELFEHEVRPITKGTRYNVSQWFDDQFWFKDLGTIQESLQLELSKFYANQPWRFGHRTDSKASGDTCQYFDVVHADGDERDLSIDRSTELLSSPTLSSIWAHLLDGPCYGQTLTRCYTNATTFGLEPAPHRDSQERNYYTTMIYAVDEWRREWGGATAFYEPSGQIHKLSEVSPWRAVQFQGNLLHQALPISRMCNALRRTLMFKGRRIYELHPDTRPFPNLFGGG